MRDENRYERQMLLADFGAQGQEKLKNSKVLLVGAGGLGNSCAMYLAGAGVGHITLMDSDAVSLNNLHRQILFSEGDVGQAKADRARAHLEERNSAISIRSLAFDLDADNAKDLVLEHDFIIDASDNFETKFLINDACVLEKKPFCHGGIVGFYGQVMTYVPGYACYRCVFEEIPRDEEAPSCKVSGTFGPAVGVLGCVQAAEAIKYITGIGTLLTGKLYTVDMLTMNTRIVTVSTPAKNCRVCGEMRDIFSVAENRGEYEWRKVCI